MTEKFNPSSEYYRIPNQEIAQNPSRLKRIGNKLVDLLLESSLHSPYGIQALQNLDSKDIIEEDENPNIIKGEN